MTGSGTKELQNCRIRTVLQNDKQKYIYIEISAREVTKYDKQRKFLFNYKIGESAAFITHVFYINDLNETANENKTGISHLRDQHLKYTKADLLEYINKNLDCSFNDLIILNDTDYMAHADKGYNLANYYIYDEEIEKQHLKVKNYFKEIDKKHLHGSYSNFSYMRNYKNKKAASVLLHYNGYNDIVKIEDVTKYQFDYTFKPKPEPEKPLTLSEALEKADSNLWYRMSGYNRSAALTEFLKGLEKDFKQSFSIINATFANLRARDDKGEISAIPTIKSVTRYAKFELNNSTYYLQYDDNYFFEAYISLQSNETHKEEARIRIFHDVDLDILCNYTNGASIEYLSEYLYNKFLSVRKDNFNISVTTPEQQSLYFRG